MTAARPIDQRPGLFGWWHEGTPEGRRALVAGGLGWMLDSFDVMLYALVLASIIPELGLSKETAGLLGSATLLASAAGGSCSASSRTGTAGRGPSWRAC